MSGDKLKPGPQDLDLALQAELSDLLILAATDEEGIHINVLASAEWVEASTEDEISQTIQSMLEALRELGVRLVLGKKESKLN